MLMVAEKPSLAQSIANILSSGKVRVLPGPIIPLDLETLCMCLKTLTRQWQNDCIIPGQQMQAHSRRSFLEVHEWNGSFRGRIANFRMTSVIGHVLSIDFPAKFQNWETTDPASLFDAPTIRSEANPKAGPLKCQDWA